MTKPMNQLAIQDEVYEVIDVVARDELTSLSGEVISITETIEGLLARENYVVGEVISLADFYLSCWNSADHLYFSIPLTKSVPNGLIAGILGKFYIRLTGTNPTGTVLSNNTLDSLGDVATEIKSNCILVTVTNSAANWTAGIGVVVGASDAEILFFEE